MTTGEPFKVPKFPALFTETDLARMQDLERLAAEQQKAYRGFVDWERKPAIVRGARRVAEVAYAPPKWLRAITPWQEFGVTPEQADIYIRETEEELVELKRRQAVAERAPTVADYIVALAAAGLLTGEEAQLYELIPELNPYLSDSLNLTEEERVWFTDYAKLLSGKSPEEIYDLYREGGFPAPKTVEELIDLVKVTIPEPRQALTSISLSRNLEDITAYLQEAYAPQVEEGLDVPLENIKSELRSLGLTPTGDVKKDIEALEKARAEGLKETGVPVKVTLKDGTVLALDRKEDGFYSEEIKVANIDSSGNPVALTEAEEFELDNVPPATPIMPASQQYLREWLRGVSEEDVDRVLAEFYALNGDIKGIEQWARTYTALKAYPDRPLGGGYIEMLARWSRGSEPPAPLGIRSAYEAGWGDVFSAAGGAARWMGEEGIADSLSKVATNLHQGYYDNFGSFRWNHIFNPRYLMVRGSRLLPFAVSLVPATLLGWKAGIAVGGVAAVKLGLGSFGTKIITILFGGLIGGTISRSAESAMEAGMAFDRVLEMGGTMEEADAVADQVFWDNMKLVGLDITQVAVALAPVPTPLKAMAGGISRGLFRVARVGGRMMIVGLTEAGEETYQEGITRTAMGEEDPWRFDPEMQEAAFLGGYMGLGLGAGGDVISGIINNTEEAISPTIKEQYDTDVKAVGQGEALDKLAETPQGAKIIEGATKVAKEQVLNKQITNPEKRVHTEEVRFLNEQLDTIDKEIAVFREAHRVQSERLEAQKEAKAPPYELVEQQATVKKLEGDIAALTTKKASIEAKLDILGKAVPEVTEPKITVKETIVEDVFRFEATHIDFPQARGKVVLVSEPNYSIIQGLNVEQPIQRLGVGSTLIMRALSKAELIGKPVIVEKVTPAGNVLLKSMESKGLIKLVPLSDKIDIGVGKMVDVGGGKSISASYSIEAKLDILGKAVPEPKVYTIDELVDIVGVVTWEEHPQVEGFWIITDKEGNKWTVQSVVGTEGRMWQFVDKPIVAAEKDIWDKIPQSAKNKIMRQWNEPVAYTTEPWNKLPEALQVRLRREFSKEFAPVTRGVVKPIAPVAPEVLTPDQEMAGKAFNVRESIKQAQNLEGYQEAVVTLEDVARTAREALEHIDVHFFHADGSNPLDIAATAAWKLGSISEYVRLLPPDIYDNVSKEFEDADFADVAEWNLNTMDTIRAFSAIDKGYFGGVARRKILSPTERLHMAYFNVYGAYELKYLKLEQDTGFTRPAWYKFRRRKEFHNDTFALMENMSQEASTMDTAELLQRDAIKEVVKDYPAEMQTNMIDWAKGLRTLWDEMLTDQNSVRVKLGLEPIEYRENYVSWVYQPNLWSRLLGMRLKPDFVKETAIAPDFIKPTEPFVAHELAREGGLAGYTKITDVRKLFLDYADTACRDMFFTPIVMNVKAHARVLASKGFKAPSQWMLDWAIESYAGMPSFISRAFRKSAFAFLRRPLVALRRNLTRAVFPLNWTWNFAVQTSSIALTTGQYGLKNTVMGTQYLWNPKIRKLINDDCFSYIIKRRAEGSIVYQDLGATISRYQYIGRTPLQTVETVANYLTRAIESNITGVSCYAAYLKGQKMGLKGRTLIDYASEGGAKTQSMYNVQNVPGTIRSPEVGAIFPFQTFCFEAMNFARELTGIKRFRAGAYETIAADSIEGQALLKNRFKHFLEFMAAVYVMNTVGDLAIDRRPWQPTSFIPFVGIMMSGLDPYNPWYYPMPIRYITECKRGITDVFEYGDWDRLRAWTLRYHTLGGVQISRTIDGIIASIEGEVRDVSGEVMYELEDKPLEYIKAITMGPYQTEAGREFRDRVFEGADPTTIRVIKDLVKLEEQLGTDVKGRYYTLSSYGTQALAKIQDIPQWHIFGEETGYPELLQFRLYCDIMWEEYSKVPGDKRLDYRKANPYVDATLYFWERVGTLRSTEATEELEKLFKEFIADNPRAHWRGLPEIPEELKLLPE